MLAYSLIRYERYVLDWIDWDDKNFRGKYRKCSKILAKSQPNFNNVQPCLNISEHARWHSECLM